MVIESYLGYAVDPRVIPFIKDGKFHGSHKEKKVGVATHIFEDSSNNLFIRFYLINKSNRPIKTNYFADKIELITGNDTVYELNFTASDYLSKSVNPNEKALILNMENPFRHYRFSEIRWSLGMENLKTVMFFQ
jgi:hypothetical protein